MLLTLKNCNIIDVQINEDEPDPKKNKILKVMVNEEDVFAMLDGIQRNSIAKYVRIREIGRDNC